MVDVTYPARRTAEAQQHDRAFIEVMEAMLRQNETISARAVARRLESVDHASSITRDSWRNDCLIEWQGRQREMRKLALQLDKRSKTNAAADLERSHTRIRELEAQIDLLRASHRAMIRAVGEMGGMQAWMRFFAKYQSLLDKLRDIGALPDVPAALPAANAGDADAITVRDDR